jgi:hypothetical protein
VKRASASQWNDSYRAYSSPSRGKSCRRAIRPIEAFKATIRNGCFTSTPDISFVQTRSFAATWRTDQFDPCSPIFAPRGIGLTNRAPDAHVDVMLGIERNCFAGAQSGASEYGLG